MNKKLHSDFRFVDLTNEEFQKHWDEWGPRIFDDQSTNLDTRKILSDEEKTQLRRLMLNTNPLIRINIGIFKGERFCGWFSGEAVTYPIRPVRAVSHCMRNLELGDQKATSPCH